jgi:glutamate/tyrosine decarboxylase-like PLP-dependent enzyme
MKKTNSKKTRFSLPVEGVKEPEIFKIMTKKKQNDVDWQRGRIWGLVYYATEDLVGLQNRAYKMFFNENALGPSAFPSVMKFEAEIVSMIIALLRGGSESTGTMTSGGTESTILAIKAYRDYYRLKKPDSKCFEIVIPQTAHPAFVKAADYFNIKVRRVPVGNDYRAVPDAIENAINENTIMIGASAPNYTQGVVDPIPELGQIALCHDIGLHVDSCLGGFMLPFLRKQGRSVPEFDLSVPGVSSISVDLHKYGYAAKGAGAVLYRNQKLRRCQFFLDTQWPGGLYASATMLGTRSAGIIASAWALMMYLGENGYIELTQKTIEATEKMISGICDIPHLEVVGQPDMSVFSFTSKKGNIFSIARQIERTGWMVNTQTNPDSIHIIVTVNHIKVIDKFLEDLRRCVEEAPMELSDDKGIQPLVIYGKMTENSENKTSAINVIKTIEKNYEVQMRKID